MTYRKKLGLSIGSLILGVSVLFNPVASTEASAAGASTVQQNSSTYQTTANLNIRKGASTSYAIVTTIPKGKNVTVSTSKKVGSTTWYNVSYSNYSGWVIGTYLKEVSTTASSDNTSIKNVALNYLGTRYQFGGTTPSGFDCSGYITYVLNEAGYSTPRKTAASFYNSTTKVSKPQVGDLVFFSGTYKSGISHVGIYIGNNKMVSASNDGVKIDKVNSSYWGKYFTGYGRI